ncbi:MAG: hypothetical protein AB7H88_06420 [Vicinamibacterales bacterium]
MPIRYTFDLAKRLVISTWTGPVTATDLDTLWSAYMAAPEFARCDGSLADVRLAQIQFTGRELSDRMKSLAIPAVGPRPFAAAVLVASPAQYGSARQHGVFASYTTMIFHEEEAALAWLETQVSLLRRDSGSR